MDEWFSSTLGFLERIPKIAFQLSATLVVIGGGLVLSFRAGFIPKEAFNGYASDAASLMLVVGLAIFVLGVLWALYGLLTKIPAWRASKEAKKVGLRSLLENMRFLHDDALFVLLDILNQPSGRVPSVGNIPIMNALGRLSLVEAESPYSSPTDRGVIIRPSELLMDSRDEVKGYVKTMLLQHGNTVAALDDLTVVRNRSSRALKAEIEARDHQSGGF